MLDFTLTEQHDSIEECFAKKFDKLTKYPMDNLTAEIFVKLLLCKDSSYCLSNEEKPFLYQILEKRISQVHSFRTDDRVLLFLCFICKSAGVGIMYCWYIQFMSKQFDLKQITFEDFANIFKDGFPSDESLQQLWDSQKVKIESLTFSDNLLDYPNAGISLI